MPMNGKWEKIKEVWNEISELKTEANLKMKTILFSKEKKSFQMASIIGEKYANKKIELH